MTSTPLQTPPQPPVPFRRRPLFTPYVVMWTLGGIFAASYMIVAVASPDLLEDLTPTSAVIADPQSNQGQRASARLAAEINALRDSISQVQLDLAKVKTDVASHGAREKQLSAQLVALEQKLTTAEQHAIETTAPRTPGTSPQQEAAAPRLETPPELRVDAPGLTLSPPSPSEPDDMQSVVGPAQPKLINADASAKPAIETANVKSAAKAEAKPAADPKAPAQTAFTTAIIRPAPKPVGVLLSSGASVDSLRLSWSLLADRHADTLKNMEARYLTSGDAANPNFDLVAGPIKSKAEAQKVCKTLAARNIPCKIGDFAGDAL